jgi:thiamine-monophosphate kinase
MNGSGEDRLIARFFSPLATHPAALGLTDDAAVLTAPDRSDLVLTADALVAGVHFFADDPPDTIARKALRVNLSDLAAKGADPLGFLLTLALSESTDEAWLSAFSNGLRADAQAFRCPLFGGDTTRTHGPVVISITAIGSLPDETMVRRSGAAPDDGVFVTGTIGDAALGLLLRANPVWAPALSQADRTYLADRYLLPRPRNALASALRTHASAAMDVSDGLAGDLAKLCRVSQVSADVEVDRVPLSTAAKTVLATDAALIDPILTGGDDYEVACTVPEARIAGFLAAAARAGVAVTRIGTIRAADGPPVFRAGTGDKLAFRQASFSHFR